MLSTKITFAEVLTAVAPELKDLPLDVTNPVMAWINDEFAEGNWPSLTQARRAAMFLAAHVLTMRARENGGTAPLQSIRVGDISKTYAVSMAADAHACSTTGYGREYLRLHKRVNARWAVT